MEETDQRTPRNTKISYHILFVLGALLHLALLVISVINLQKKGYIVSLWTSLVIPSIITLALLIIGLTVIRHLRSDVLRLGAIIGLPVGIALGNMIGIVASGPHNAAMGVAIATITVFPLSLMYVPYSIFITVLQLTALLGIMRYVFWMVRRSASIAHGIESTLFFVGAIVVFTFITGIIYSLNFGKIDELFYYGAWTMLFVLPICPLLFYALVAGIAARILLRLRS